MVHIHKENVNSTFKGTIIDIETIGNFNNAYTVQTQDVI